MTEENYELRDYEKVQEEYEGQSVCRDAAKEIARLRAENAALRQESVALKEQVAQLKGSVDELTRKYQEHAGNYYAAQETITTLQSKSAALVDAATELVACKNLKNQVEAIRFAGPNSSHGADFESAASALESNYNLRKPDAWINVCAALAAFKE